MKSNTSDDNCTTPNPPKKKGWIYPPDRPWVEFVVIITLATISLSSIGKLLVSTSEARKARNIAIERLDFIYNDLSKKDNELKRLKIEALKEEREFHRNLDNSMKIRNLLLKEIAIKVGIDGREIDNILSRDPIYRENK